MIIALRTGEAVIAGRPKRRFDVFRDVYCDRLPGVYSCGVLDDFRAADGALDQASQRVSAGEGYGESYWARGLFNPENRLTDGEVAKNLLVGGVRVERLPKIEVIWIFVREAGEEE